MFYMNLMTKTSLFAFLILFLNSCQKEELSSRSLADLSKHKLWNRHEAIIKMNQAISVYDITGLKDSIDFVNPPTSRNYKWKAIPDNGCVSFEGKFRNGIADIHFKCPGNYQITADIYDSTTNQLIARTDTLHVEVTNETLQSAQSIHKDDTLLVRPGIVQSRIVPYNPGDPPDQVYISLVLSTSKSYEYHSDYNHFEYSTHSGNNSYTFVFADSLKLKTYPFAYGNGTHRVVWHQINLEGLTMGVASTLSINWLGKAYTGKITLINYDQFSLEWENTGMVKFIK